MKRKILVASLFVAAVVTACKKETSENTETVKTETQESSVMSQQEMIVRGKYLVTIGGCHDCHTPKVMTDKGPALDTTRLLSGHNKDEKLPLLDKNAGKDGWARFTMGLTAAVGPWGTSFAANLTPHDTGIGSMTFEQFETVLRRGKYKGMDGSRDLLPPMPWFNFIDAKEEDLRAIFAYLKSLPPVDNQVPLPIPPAQ